MNEIAGQKEKVLDIVSSWIADHLSGKKAAPTRATLKKAAALDAFVGDSSKKPVSKKAVKKTAVKPKASSKKDSGKGKSSRKKSCAKT